MIRKLIDYKKLDHKMATKLIETYPDGYGDDDIIVFKNIKGEIVETVELRTNDTIYLVKISKCLANFISNFEENMEKGMDIKMDSETDEATQANMELLSEEEFED